MGMLHPRHAFHGRCGSFKGKLVLAGVTLWLTSTIIAGVRRSSGWTHNSYGLPAPPTSSVRSNNEDQVWHDLLAARAQSPRDFVYCRRLEQQYLDSAPDTQVRELREHRLGEHYRYGDHSYRHRCSGGFVQWYLGIGERTFDWAVRRISASHKFHKEDPTTPYWQLVRDAQYRHTCSHSPMPRSYIGTSRSDTPTQ
ncbi:hypothetical protein IWW35_001772 [Coemansia sp. RSA 1878]|nr:hypothetical protein IWW35_001772 [Coemansia sp. RSA 1878]